MCSSVFCIWYKDVEYWHLIILAESNLIIHLRLLSILHDICPQMSLWFTHRRNHFCSKQSVISFVWGAIYFCPADLSLEAKPGRGDVMMAIAYNAPASCRCTDPPLSWGMTSAMGVQREHLLDDLVSRMQIWSDARHYTGETFLIWFGGAYL